MMLRLAFVLCAFLAVTHASNILVLVPINGKSHWNYMQVFVKELLLRGHEVTCITSNTLGEQKFDNYTEILIDPPYKTAIIKHDEIYSRASDAPFKAASLFPHYASLSSDHALSHPKVQELINSTDLHFDLVINEEIFHDAFLMFGRKFNAPVVTICPYGVNDHFDHDMGLITPMSHVGHTMTTFTDKMSFGQRWYNTILTVYDWYVRRFVHRPLQEDIVNKHFGNLGPLPSYDELRSNISIIFTNAHRSITFPRPSMPGLIYIGGAHIKPPKPLPSDLQTFIDEAEHGVIYFSLGTVINTSKMPKEKLNAILDTFRQLKQRVIWKYEDESIPNLPHNVLIRKWLPQTDILAHPKVVLLISHGGMFSNFEAVNYGIQMLVIPFVCDQYRNAMRAQNAGYGKYLDFKELNNQTLFSTLNEMLTDKKYTNRAKEISTMFSRNMLHPMDEFMWWIEYVIEFNGAKHLKSAAIDLPLYSYLLLDVMLANAAVFLVVSFAIYYCIVKVSSMKKKYVAVNKKQQ